jgi:hypothetical protein
MVVRVTLKEYLSMRVGLLDLLIGIIVFGFSFTVSMKIAIAVHPFAIFLCPFIALALYLVVLTLLYRTFAMPPMVLPMCPCGKNRRRDFELMDSNWPRIKVKCSQCDDPFIIWYRKVDSRETWDAPVLENRWPYFFGRYIEVYRTNE